MGEGDFDQSAEHGLVARPVCPTQEVIRVEVVRNLQGGLTKVNQEVSIAPFNTQLNSQH